MKKRHWQIILAAGMGAAAISILADRPAAAAERTTLAQPVVNFSAPYTRLLGAAPIKPPVLFADDTDAVAAKIEAVSWYNSGGAAATAFPFYRGYGGWYGPWAGYGGYGYGGFGGYGYFGAPFAGYWSGAYRPYGYYNFFSPFGWAYPYYAGSQPFGAYPMVGTGSPFPPNVSMGTVAYPPYGMGMAGLGGGVYW
jgi:hypothetical protein